MSNEENSSNTNLPESMVSHIFGFVLGLISGINANRRLFANSGRTLMEDPPEGLSMAYSKLDTLAGDALLKTDTLWFLFEMKRDFASLKSELSKPKSTNLYYWLTLKSAKPEIKELLTKAKSAHRFLYLSLSKTTKNHSGYELATLSYLHWLDATLPEITGTPNVELSQHKYDFTEWLFKARKENQGFDSKELVRYVKLMNTSAKGVVRADAADVEGRLAVAISKSGVLTAVTNKRIMELMNSLEAERALQATEHIKSEGSRRHQGQSFGG